MHALEFLFGTKLPIMSAMAVCLGALASPVAEVATVSTPGTVLLQQDASFFTLANGLLTARIAKESGVLVSLKYQGMELLAQKRGGAEGGYWSSVGRGRPGGHHNAVVRCDPGTNGGARAEISCQLLNEPESPAAPVDAEYRYALGRGEPSLYVYSVLTHKPGYPAFGVGEARYCLKLNPEVFDYLIVDANRRRLMPSGYDWDHGSPLNMKEARRMTTGVHKGEAEHKYDYSAVLAETPAYGWSSTRQNVGLWLINPSFEYLGGGPTKAELTGHLDVNAGGLPTLLNMWVGSHYGGTTVAVATNESWTKVVGPFVLYCNRVPASEPRVEPTSAAAANAQTALWRDALARAGEEARRWPYRWVNDTNYPLAAGRGGAEGQLVLNDPFAPGLKMSNLWVGLTAPDYFPPRWGFAPRRMSPAQQGSNQSGEGRVFNDLKGSNRSNVGPMGFPGGGPGFGPGRLGFPPCVDWQRDAKFYQYWARGDGSGRFIIPHVRPGKYTLHAIADGVLGEFTLTNVAVQAGAVESLGRLTWTPQRFGRTLWEIGVPDRTAREFRHGDQYWQWGLYFEYATEFPSDVNFVVGKSDWRRDWNYVQPPRIEAANVGVTGEDEEQSEGDAPDRRPPGDRAVRSSTWAVTFTMPEAGRGEATLRLAFCGTHLGCNVQVLVNGQSVGETGPLPSTSAMQRDGIRAYWVEKDVRFDAAMLGQGTNVIKLLSHANSWSQGVMYDYLRLEMK